MSDSICLLLSDLRFLRALVGRNAAAETRFYEVAYPCLLREASNWRNLGEEPEDLVSGFLAERCLVGGLFASILACQEERSGDPAFSENYLWEAFRNWLRSLHRRRSRATVVRLEDVAEPAAREQLSESSLVPMPVEPPVPPRSQLEERCVEILHLLRSTRPKLCSVSQQAILLLRARLWLVRKTRHFERAKGRRRRERRLGLSVRRDRRVSFSAWIEGLFPWTQTEATLAFAGGRTLEDTWSCLRSAVNDSRGDLTIGPVSAAVNAPVEANTLEQWHSRARSRLFEVAPAQLYALLPAWVPRAQGRAG